MTYYSSSYSWGYTGSYCKTSSYSYSKDYSNSYCDKSYSYSKDYCYSSSSWGWGSSYNSGWSCSWDYSSYCKDKPSYDDGCSWPKDDYNCDWSSHDNKCDWGWGGHDGGCDWTPPDCDTNTPPTPVDDSAKTCADETVLINVLDNDTDSDGDTLTVVSISDDDETAGVGGSITLASGAIVTLNADGTVTYDGIAAHADLLIGEQASDAFSYTVSDGEDTASANVDVDVCGAKNTPDTLEEMVFDGATVDVNIVNLTKANAINGYDGTLSNLQGLDGYTIADLGGPAVGKIYCLDASQDSSTGVVTTAEIHTLTEANALAFGVNAAGAANVDLVNWILNQDWSTTDNGDGTGSSYTDLEVQEAIWGLINGDHFLIGQYSITPDNNNGVREANEPGTIQNAEEIMAMAQADGEGFVAGSGDVLGLLLEPIAPDAQDQPLIIGVDFDTFAQDCLCA